MEFFYNLILRKAFLTIAHMQKKREKKKTDEFVYIKITNCSWKKIKINRKEKKKRKKDEKGEREKAGKKNIKKN